MLGNETGRGSFGAGEYASPSDMFVYVRPGKRVIEWVSVSRWGLWGVSELVGEWVRGWDAWVSV